MASLLGQLKGAVAVGELRHVWQRGFEENQLCSCGKPFYECGLWSEVSHGVLQRLGHSGVAAVREASRVLDRRINAPGLVLSGRFMERSLEVYAAGLHVLYEELVSVSGARTIIDSSKTVAFGAVLRAATSGHAQVIHLIRDPRAVAFSWGRTKHLVPGPSTDATMGRHSAAKVTLGWLGTNILWELMGRRFADYRKLKYEDFCRAPSETLEQVRAMLAEDPIHPMTGRNETEVGAHIIAGNPLRFQPIRAVEEDDEWKQGMSPASRLVTTVISLPLMLKYGYSLTA